MENQNPYRAPAAEVDIEGPVVILVDYALNPWYSMWTKPRATIQQIVSSNPNKQVLLLACLAGFSQAMDNASVKNQGDSLEWPYIVLSGAIGGPIGGLIGLYLGGLLLCWTGRWVGGQASSQHVRTAIAWAGVPIVWSLLIWIPELLLFGQELFTSETPRLDASVPLTFTLVGFGVIELIIALWVIVVLLKCLGQVHGFLGLEGTVERGSGGYHRHRAVPGYLVSGGRLGGVPSRHPGCLSRCPRGGGGDRCPARIHHRGRRVLTRGRGDRAGIDDRRGIRVSHAAW